MVVVCILVCGDRIRGKVAYGDRSHDDHACDNRVPYDVRTLRGGGMVRDDDRNHGSHGVHRGDRNDMGDDDRILHLPCGLEEVVQQFQPHIGLR